MTSECNLSTPCASVNVNPYNLFATSKTPLITFSDLKYGLKHSSSKSYLSFSQINPVFVRNAPPLWCVIVTYDFFGYKLEKNVQNACAHTP